MQVLDEIQAGVFDGWTYAQIERDRPEEFAARKADKLRYRQADCSLENSGAGLWQWKFLSPSPCRACPGCSCTLTRIQHRGVLLPACLAEGSPVLQPLDRLQCAAGTHRGRATWTWCSAWSQW